MKKNLRIASYVVALSIASGLVVVDGAGAEPYIKFDHRDAFVQVGIGIALIILWVQFAVWLVYAALTRRVARPWLAVTVWIVMVVFYLWESPVGYVNDITKFVIEKQ